MPETQSPDVAPNPVETAGATENAANDTRTATVAETAVSNTPTATVAESAVSDTPTVTVTESVVNDTPTVEESASDAPPMPTFRLFPSLPSPEEQIETIAAVNEEERRMEAAQIGMDIPGLTVPEDVIGRALSGGSGKRRSVERIVAFFQRNPAPERAAAFLQREFGEAYRGVTIDGKQYALGFDGEGFHIAQGDSVRVTDAAVVSWRQAASMVSGLLRDGKFASQKQIDAARPNEFRELSESLWHLRQDFSEEATAAGYLRSMEETYQAYGFPEGTLQIAEALKNPEKRAQITAELREYAAACEKNSDLRRFSRISSPSVALERLERADSPLTEFHGADPESFEQVRGTFITRDEIDALFRDGDYMQHGKMQIYAYFKQGHDAKERADFLKNLYGVGSVYTRESDASYNPKGIKFRRSDEHCENGYDTVFMNWNQAARRIGQLIEAGAYLNDKERAALPRYQLLQLARSVQTFQYHSADNAVWNPQDAEKRIIPLLENPEKSAELYREMARTMENTPLSNANYRAMKKALRDMEAYQKGEYSIFTPLSEEALEEERAERAARKLAEKQEREDFQEGEEADAEEAEKIPDGEREAKDGEADLMAAARRLARKRRTPAKEQANGQFSLFGEEPPAPETPATPEKRAVPEEVPATKSEKSPLLQADYRLVQEKEGHFILVEEKARRAAKLLNLPLTTREMNGDGPLDVCEIPADRLDEAVEKLRRGCMVAVLEFDEKIGKLKPPRFFDALEPAPEQDANAPDNADERKEAQQLLSRLVADCVYFLDDPEHSVTQLWAGNIEAQVAKMRELYAQFPENSDWISESEIEEYARKMTAVLTENEAESVAEPTEQSEAVTKETPDDNVTVISETGQPEADAPGKQYDLGYGYLGNGLTVWNRLEEENGDYKTVAHIDPERSVTFYDADMPENVRAAIIREAATSVLPDTPAFSTPPIAPEQVAVKTAYSPDEESHQTLMRLILECEYFIAAPRRDIKRLSEGNVEKQVTKMRELRAQLPKRFSGVTEEDIDGLARQMAEAVAALSSQKEPETPEIAESEPVQTEAPHSGGEKNPYADGGFEPSFDENGHARTMITLEDVDRKLLLWNGSLVIGNLFLSEKPEKSPQASRFSRKNFR